MTAIDALIGAVLVIGCLALIVGTICELAMIKQLILYLRTYIAAKKSNPSSWDVKSKQLVNVEGDKKKILSDVAFVHNNQKFEILNLNRSGNRSGKIRIRREYGWSEYGRIFDFSNDQIIESDTHIVVGRIMRWLLIRRINKIGGRILDVQSL